MDKIFKRNSKGATEQVETTIKSPPEAAEPTAHENKSLGHLVEGHLPKFSWTHKPQGEQKANRLPVPPEKDIPDDIWIKCAHCKELIYSKEFEINKMVCHKCGHHFRMGAPARIADLLDEGSFTETDPNLVTTDPLGFTALTESPYHLKAAETRKKSGLKEAIVTGFGTLEEMPLGIAVCDFAYQGGSMGSVFGEKLVRLIEGALERKLPVLTISASGGARMHEGMFSLMQMAKTTAALARLGEAGLPHFSLLTDPCTGGVIASYASVADVVIAEPGALIGFAGPRVIEQITKQKLPPGFQSAEFLLEHGMIDRVVPRKELRGVLAGLLKFYGVAYNHLKEPALPPVSLQLQPEREVSYAG